MTTTTTATTILLVEDEALIALAETHILARYGYKVIRAATGLEGIARIRDDPTIDLVLMDIDLGPGIDGTVTARKILEIRELPIVFLSSHTEREIVDKVKGITRYGYVVKNSGEFVLIETIQMARELFEAHRLTRMNELRYETLFAAVADAVFMVDEESGVILEANTSACEIFGYDHEEFVGMPAWHLSSEPEQTRRIVSIPDGPSVHVPDRRMIRKDGTTFIADIYATHHVIGGRGINITTIRDVTESLLAIANLRKSETRFRQLFETMQEGVAIYEAISGDESDSDGTNGDVGGSGDSAGVLDFRFVDINDAGVRMAPVPREEIIGRRIGEVFPGAEQMGLVDLLRAVYRDGRPRDLPIEQYEDGRFTQWVENRVIRLPAGYVAAIYEDTTQRHHAEEELKRREMILTEAQEIADFGHYVLDIPRGRWSHSPKLDDIFGIDADYDATVPGWLQIVHPEDRATMERYLSEHVFGDRQRFDREYRIVDQRTGAVRWVHGHGKLVTAPDGTPVELIGTIQDITPQKETETHLRATVDLKENLIRETHHRVKNNLMMVAALVGLQDSSFGGEVDLDDIKSQLDAITALHEQLSYTGGDGGGVAPGPYFEQIVATVLGARRDGRLAYRIEMEEVLLPIKSVAPLGLIVNELATNTVKHGCTREKGTTLTIRGNIDGDMYRITITNDGPAIPDSISFDNPRTLGMRLVGALAEQLGGTLRIERAPHPRFEISIPSR
ncbi:MAG: PAS domain S-box protein [Alkalispirochaeta sp.]